MSYRPLPDCLTIKNSEIEGLGLFATEDITAGTELGETHVFTGGSDGMIFRTPLGGFYNHSNDSNAEKIESQIDDDLYSYELVTTKNIKAGEEITVTYTLYKIN